MRSCSLLIALAASPTTVWAQSVVLTASGHDGADSIWRSRPTAGVPSWGINGTGSPLNGFIWWNSFPGSTAEYQIELGAVLEADGNSQYRLEVGGSVVAQGRYPYAGGQLECTQGSPALATHLDLGQHMVNNGDLIRLWGESVYPCGSDHGQYTRFWEIKFTPVVQPNQPPVPIIDTPSNGAVYAPGAQINYAGHATDPEDGPLPSTSLAFELTRVGQGVVHSSSGDSGSFTFPASISVRTEYTLELTATDSNSVSANTDITIYAQPASVNGPPAIASVEATPNPVEAGLAVQLSCTASDPDQDPLTYAWDFGDGNSDTGASPVHTYQTAGTYTAQVSVSDGHNHTSTDDVVVTVSDPSDVIVIEAEEMTLSNYEIEGDYIATMTAGTAVTSFPGVSGCYRIEVVIIKENDGEPTVVVRIAGTTIETIVYALGSTQRDPETVEIGVHCFSTGDEIELDGTREGDAAARLDKMRFELTTPLPDAGTSDSGFADVDSPDAMTPDTATRDAGFPDAAFDASTTDASSEDGAAKDAAKDGAADASTKTKGEASGGCGCRTERASAALPMLLFRR